MKEKIRKLKQNVDMIHFLKQVKKCKYDVYLETDNEDRLNLKSILSQYVVAVLVEQKDILDHCRIECDDADVEILQEYVI